MTMWNLAVFNFIHAWSGHSVFADITAIFFAEYLPYLLVAGFLVLVFYQSGTRRKFYLFAEGAIAVILARGIVTEAIRFFYNVPRPFALLGFSPLIAESGASFPSGHMTWFFALALVIWFADRKWGFWYFVLSAAIGIARIYAGVHWPLDIVGGVAIGLASGWLVHSLFRGVRAELIPAKKPESVDAVI
ncbi:MAG: phosphatase PAP2 family protein [Minisyncoccia bacterium]